MKKLPTVNGWILDYRTAQGILDSGNNERISHTVAKFQCGEFHISHAEKSLYKASEKLNFVLEAAACIILPDHAIQAKCCDIATGPLGSKMLIGNNSIPYIAAAAASLNYGVCSNSGPSKFLTHKDVCEFYGLTFLSDADYFSIALV